MKPLECDVLVVGGGAAGLAAATAAGGAGARVVLLERYGFLGGLATAGAVGTICGLYLRDTRASVPRPMSEGFVKAFGERLARQAGTEPMRLDPGLWILPFVPWAFERLADAIVSEAPNVQVVLHATVGNVVADGQRIHEVRALAWNEEITVSPRWIVDATGEATVVHLAGIALERGITEQAPALLFVLENLGADFSSARMLEVLRTVRRGVEDGHLPAACVRLSYVPGSAHDGRVALKLNLEPGTPGVPDWRQVSANERHGRALVDLLQRYLIEHTPGLRQARLSGVAPQLGVRTGRRIRGRATLTDSDVLEARKFNDGIARGAWPVEQWLEGPQPVLTFFPEHEYYEIPLGCLQPVELEQVLVPGRAISASAGALASARVIGTALATGWAAGTVAARQALGQSAEAAVAAIREHILA